MHRTPASDVPTHFTYLAEVDVGPAYELVISLWAYADREHRLSRSELQRLLETAVPRLPSAFLDRVERLNGAGGWGALLSLPAECPAPRDVDSFLNFLDELPPEELARRVRKVPEPRGGLELPPEAVFKLDVLMTLREWHRSYFQNVAAEVMPALERDAAIKRELSATLSPERLVELAAGPLRMVAAREVQRLVMIPQYHQRPWTFYIQSGEAQLIFYPAGGQLGAEVAAAETDEPSEPPEPLTRLTRALGDTNRLRILRLLAGGDRDFRELAVPLKLSKSTVHHHLGALRAAGLIQLRGRSAEGGRYSLRRESLADLAALLQQYLRDQ